MTVLVIGATGTTGSAVVTELVAARVKVRAQTRSAAKLAALSAPGVEAVVAPLDDPDAVREALHGVESAYLVTPSAPDMADTEGSFARAAAAAGVHLVKLSVLGAHLDSPLRLARMHAESEAAIESSGGSWTFIRPTGFMQNDLAWAAQIPTGTISGPVMDAAWSIVDVRDVAAVAAVALGDPAAYRGRGLAVTGPEARTPRSRVGALAAIIGRELTAVEVPVAAVKDQLRGNGIPDWEVHGLGELFDLYATGAAARTAPDAATVLGRQTRTWETFTADHKAAFAGS